MAQAPPKPLTYERLIVRLEAARDGARKAFPEPNEANRLLEIDNAILKAINLCHRGIKGEVDANTTPADVKHNVQQEIKSIHLKYDTKIECEIIESNGEVRQVSLDEYKAAIANRKEGSRSEVIMIEDDEEEVDTSLYLGRLQDIQKVFFAEHRNHKTQVHKDAKWVFKGAEPRIEMAESKYEAQAVIHEAQSTLKKLRKEHLKRMAIESANSRYAFPPGTFQQLSWEKNVDTSSYRPDNPSPAPRLSIHDLEHIQPAPVTTAKRLRESARESTSNDNTSKRIKASLNPQHEIKPFPTFDPSVTPAQAFYMAVEWVSESIKSQYPIVLTVTHDELLAEIKKRTLSELGLTTSESEDIVGGEGHNPPGNGASEVDEEISPASPAGRTATTPDEMAASAQSPPATSQSEIGVSQGLFESKDREPTAAGDEFMSDAEIYEDSGNPGQQSLVDLMAKDSPEGSARGDVDEDMEDAVRESRL